MTNSILKKLKKKSIDFIKRHSLIITIAILIWLSIFESDKIKEYAVAGINLCGKSIIPALFPFMIFSDIISSAAGTEAGRKFGNGSIIAYITAVLCGFPMGAICVKQLYTSSVINKDKAENLLSVCSLPSLAFVISGVGVGMLGSAELGFMLWISIVLSSLAMSFIVSNKSDKSIISNNISRQKFDFAESIKKSGYTMISVCAFIIFFSVVIGMVCSNIKNEPMALLLASLIEIGNACYLISNSNSFNLYLKLIFIAFALGFSGFSVYMQTVSVINDGKLSCKNYIRNKLIQGIVASGIISIYCLIKIYI